MEKNILKNYKKNPKFFDELVSKDNSIHAFAEKFAEEFNLLSLREIAHVDQLAAQFFENEGIIFNVYGSEDEGRVFPMDIVPRVMSYKEWDFIQKGLNQRLQALNLFLKDIYTEEKILKDKAVPLDLIHESPHFLKVMKEALPPFDVYVQLCGSDLVRCDGDIFILEDNLRVPSGSSYMLMCRQVMRQRLPRLFRRNKVKSIEDYPLKLLKSLKGLSEKENPAVALLTPGVFNSAYFEHAFLAQQMQVDLVQGQDLIFENNKIYMKMIKGLKQVDVIYRRVDDVFLDPLAFREDSLLGVPGFFSAYRSGSVVIANAPGTGIADDKAVYSYIPKIIKYYLKEDPILNNVPSYLCRDKKSLDYVINNIDKLVVKPVGASGGCGLIIGHQASKKELEEFKEKIKAEPKGYIAQPVLNLSTSPCFIDNKLEPRHIDLRPFVLFNKDFQAETIPGGLCRVALKKGSLVVNSSQGGGSKDMWVLE